MPRQPKPRRVGRPGMPLSERQRVMNQLCARIACGELVKVVAPELGIDRSTPYLWIRNDPVMRRQYDQARELQAHAFAEDTLSIADASDTEGLATSAAIDAEPSERLRRQYDLARVNRDKLRVDIRKWVASKLAPRAYGESLQLAATVTEPRAVVLLPSLISPPALHASGGLRENFAVSDRDLASVVDDLRDDGA